jgi:SAM-dependent methyltransferase
MEKYYDRENQRLVYINTAADAAYWDSHWSQFCSGGDVRNYVSVVNRHVLKCTRRHVAPGSRILEGGCGRGQNVYTLHANGYDVYGVDFAPETVSRINNAIPELKVSLGDVRHLPFEEGFFDAYWSLGVIEHFYDGYDEVSREMRRVLRKGGYLFLTAPSMSRLRRLKAALGRYPDSHRAVHQENDQP